MRSTTNGGEQDAHVDTFNFVKLGFDETDGEQRGGHANDEADTDMDVRRQSNFRRK